MLTADVFGYDDGSQFIMYVAYAGGSDPGGDGDQRDNVQGYYEYLTVADGAATVAGEGTPDIAAAALIKANYVCINRDRQGYIWIGYYDKNEAPDDYAIVGTTTTNPTGDPAWGTRTILTDLARDIGTGDGAGDQGSCEFVNFSSGNLGGMFLVGKDTTGVDYLYGINIEGYNGSTFDVTEGVETPTLITIKTGVNDSTDWPFEAVVDSTDTAHILYQITSTGTSTVSKKASSAGTVEAWGSEITVDSNTPDTVTLSINWATSPDTLYAFYHYGTSTVRYRTTPVDTIAWSGESTLTEADNFDFMTASRRDEDGFISIMYTNAASAFTVTMQRIGLSGGNANVDVMLYDDAGELESTVSSAASTYTRVRSGALTLGADDYTARLKLDAGSGTAYVKAARLVIVQTNATNITDTQTQIEMGDNQNVTTTSDTQLTGKKTYLYDTSKFSGTETHYFEASLDSAGSTIGLEQQINIVDQQFTTGATSTGIVRIDETKYNGETYYFEVVAKVTSGSGTAVLTYDAGTGSTPSGGSTVTISSITATTFTRYRSAAFSPSSTQNAYVSSLTGTGTTVNAARIIIVQVSTSTITDSQTVVEVGSSQTTTNTSYTQLTDKKIYGYDADVFSPAPTAYFEASLQSGTAPTTTGPSNPGTTGNATNGSCTDDSNWSGVVSTITSDDTNYTQITGTAFDSGNVTDELRLSNFGFSIPNGDTISGITVDVLGWTPSGSGDASYQTVSLFTAPGTNVGDNKATGNLPGSDPGTTYTTFGGSADSWTAGLTEAQVEDTGFGVAFCFTAIGNNRTINLDHVRITITSTSTITVSAALYTDGASCSSQVSSSEVTNATATWQRVRSSAITLADNTDYMVCIKTSASTSTIANAKIVQEQTGTITKVEMLHSMVNRVVTDTDSTYTRQNFDNQYTPGSFDSGTFSYFFEATLKTSAGTGFAQARDEDTPANLTNGETSTTSTSYVRSRPASAISDMPSSNKILDTELKNSASNTTSVAGSWLVVQASSLSSVVTVYASLYTNGATCTTQMSGSEVSSTSTSWTRVRSAAISGGLTNSTAFMVCVRSSDNSVTPAVASAKIVVEQTAAGGLTDIETVQQYNNSLATDADTTYTSQDYDNRFEKDNFAAGTFVAYFESTLKTSNGSNAYFAQIDTPLGEVTAADTSYTRKRSASDLWSSLPASATNIDVQLKNASTTTTSSASSWLIIQISAMQIPEMVIWVLPLAIFMPFIVKWYRLRKVRLAAVWQSWPNWRLNAP